MQFLVAVIRFALGAALLCGALAGCSGKKPTHESFAGKWQSSKLETPLHLYSNGEWEIRKDDGVVLQYGLWDYANGAVVWTVKLGVNVSREVNPVVSVTDTEFRLQEGQATTVFKRLGPAQAAP